MLNLNTESINCTVSFHSVIVLNFAISNRETFIFLKSCTLHHFKKNLNAAKNKRSNRSKCHCMVAATQSSINPEFAGDTAK